MILVGLTGGIGSGKSTVSAMLAALGAVIIDADAITRELQVAGSPLVTAIGDRFGADVILPDGSLDRAALAAKVFNDPEALKDLNGIVHPAVGVEILRRIAEQRDTDHIVVLDVPLLAESPRADTGAVLVVDLEPELAIERLVAQRGMDEADARARLARQATREQRLALADRVIDNSGDRADLESQVAEIWEWLQALPPVAR